jgi:hypothetical protein
MAKIDTDEYLIHSNECFQEFSDKDKLESAPDNYYVGANDPRETDDPNLQMTIVPGSLWHDTANGILKKLTVVRINLFNTQMDQIVWVQTTGDKLVLDCDGKIVGRIVPRVVVERNQFTPFKGKPIDQVNVPKPVMSLQDLLKRVKENKDILDEDAD